MDQQTLTGPESAYRALIDAGTIQPDPCQTEAIERLQRLHDGLDGYAEQMGRQGWMTRLKRGRDRTPPPKGLYMWGGVGRGKSMLMDLFFETTAIESRKRVHFHAFMLEVHKRLHSFREAAKAGKVPTSSDPLVALSRVIIQHFNAML